MSELSNPVPNLPPEQEAIRAKCFHPTGTFVEFKREEIEQSIPERFEKIVRMYPERTAVKTQNCTLTYETLNKSANRAANAIFSRLGVGQKPVALLLDNDASLIAAILGVLKAGKMYVPLDLSCPPARIRSNLDDSGADLIVADNKTLSVAKDLARNQTQLLNTDELYSACTENLGLALSPDALAYIMYTSGSTGEPKGVLQNHRNVLQKVMTQTNDFHISIDDGLALLYAYHFSASVRVIFGALLNGAGLFPTNPRDEGLARLASWLNKREISLYYSVPTLFRQLLSVLSEGEKFSTIRLVYLGSEPVTTKDVELFKRHFSPQCVLVNSLASSEAGTMRQYFITRDTPITGNHVPVGYEVSGREVLLVDDNGRLVGPNVVGQLVVKSRFLSPGYWRRPEQTQATFLPDPGGSEKRLYFTEDLGLMLLDGCLVYLGRRDFQVKIRGKRVEIGEIENALLQLDNIREAVVVARELRHGETSLVAYAVAMKHPPPNALALRSALREKLPDYMIPSRFIFLDALPSTITGKIDRRALPDPNNSRPEMDIPYVSPRTSTEEQLAQIWGEVLSLERVGIYDNFFDLGGHSLAATRVISLVFKQFQMEVPLQLLFQSPTVDEMAAVIAEHQTKKLGEEELARILAELESLSDEEAQRLVANQPVAERR